MKKFFKRFLAITSIFVLTAGAFIGCQRAKDTTDQQNTAKESSELQEVRLNEVVRSVFYAPMYVAINEGFFEEEGLKIDLSTGQGADAQHSNTQHLSINKRKGCRINYSLILYAISFVSLS